MLSIRQNPEFIRHRRAELRFVRATTVAVAALLICLLVGLSCWTYRLQIVEFARQRAQETHLDVWGRQFAEVQANNARAFWRLFYGWIVGLQAGAVAFWSLLMCAQSVSGERERKTYDFQRATRLTAGELLVGKLFGEPVLAYFALVCLFPVTVVAGLMGGFPVTSVLLTYVLMIAASLFLGLCGLWLSTLVESRSRGVGLIGAGALCLFVVGVSGFGQSPFPGLAAFSPIPGLQSLCGARPFEENIQPTVFGWALPWASLSLILYVTFGAWLVLMLVRNLKRDFDEVRPLSRWQAMGCAIFLNLVFYALFDPYSHYLRNMFADTRAFASFMVAINSVILFALGLATLAPPERLKSWWRGRTLGKPRFFVEDGPPWPWLLLYGVVAYLLLAWGIYTWRHSLNPERTDLKTAGIQLLALLIFVTRDILFIQWCRLTRLRQPVIKGILFLCLYYASAVVSAVMATAYSESAGRRVFSVLTPFFVFDHRADVFYFPPSIYVGMVLQAVIIGVILMAIAKRLQKPVFAPVVSGD